MFVNAPSLGLEHIFTNEQTQLKSWLPLHSPNWMNRTVHCDDEKPYNQYMPLPKSKRSEHDLITVELSPWLSEIFIRNNAKDVFKKSPWSSPQSTLPTSPASLIFGSWAFCQVCLQASHGTSVFPFIKNSTELAPIRTEGVKKLFDS